MNSLHAWRYSLPVIKPLRIGGGEIGSREGVLLGLSDHNRQIGYGDVAPLPGFHRETLDEAVAQLAENRAHIRRVMNAPGLFAEPLNGNWRNELPDLLPSLGYGLETALLNLHAARKGRHLAEILCENPRETVSINYLITADEFSAVEVLAALENVSEKTVKIKVGRETIDEDAQRIKAARQRLPAEVAIRLDANRAWELEEALAFAGLIAGIDIEYIEEPLRHYQATPVFYAQSGMAVALDETMAEADADSHLFSMEGVKAIVLKPGLLGGLLVVKRIAALASQYDCKTVLSCPFESGVGLSATTSLAACINVKDWPCGLATYQWLGSDLLDTRFEAVGGRIDVAGMDSRARNIDTSTLRILFQA